MKNYFCRKIVYILIISIVFCLVGCGETQLPKQTILPTESTAQTPETTETQAPAQTQNPTQSEAPTPTQTPASLPVFKQPTEPKKYHIEISLAAQIVYIYELTENGGKGELAKAILCSTGSLDGNETPIGKWVILDNGMEWSAVRNPRGVSRYKFEWLGGDSTGQYMTRLWKVEVDTTTGEEYFAPSNYLTHSVPYYQIDRNTLMTEEWNKLGTPASRGCIRMTVEDAKWIYDYVAAYSYVYTIQGTPDPELWAALKHPDLPLNVTWDPTDVF